MSNSDSFTDSLRRTLGSAHVPARILVTGGAGFIGSALVWALNQIGHTRIVVADRLGHDEKWRNLVPLRFEDYLEADDLFARLESRALGAFDLVLHLGACSATTETDATYLARNNFEFTKRLALYSLANGARFVYASSAATYGDGAHGMDDREASLEALSRLRPLNAYGYSKHLFDQYAVQAGILDRIVGLKYFNVFGPNESHKGDMRSLVNKAYAQIGSEGIVRLFRSHRPGFADGEQRRDFLYVKDAVRMTLFLAMTPAASGLYNVGSGEANSWNALVAAIYAAMGRVTSIEYVDMPASIRDKYQYFTQANIERLRSAGYAEPVTGLADAVADYVQLYLEGDRRLGDEG